MGEWRARLLCPSIQVYPPCIGVLNGNCCLSRNSCCNFVHWYRASSMAMATGMANLTLECGSWAAGLICVGTGSIRVAAGLIRVGASLTSTAAGLIRVGTGLNSAAAGLEIVAAMAWCPGDVVLRLRLTRMASGSVCGLLLVRLTQVWQVSSERCLPTVFVFFSICYASRYIEVSRSTTSRAIIWAGHARKTRQKRTR